MLMRSLALAAAFAMLLVAQLPKHGVGRTPADEEIRALGVTVAPDGAGLPEGSGSAVEGRQIFAQRCAKCHGEKGAGDIGPALVGGQGTLTTAKPVKTVGSFWSHATSVWNYVNRAMPFNEPGSLKPPEIYAVVAHVLHMNGIVGEKEVLDRKTLPKIKMPNRDGFVPDPRPDVKPK
jgi:cytochrome c